MTLQQCRYLIEIAKHGSITRAANELFVTQPSISKAIHELEADLNITIFKRSNRGVVFTAEGQELLSYARMLVEQAETIRYHFNPETKSQVLTLSVASQHFSFVTEAAARMMEFLAERRYELSLWEGRLTDVIDQTARGISDLGVVSVSSLNRESMERSLSEQALVFSSVAALPMHVFLNRNHPLAGRDRIEPGELAAYPCLTYRKNDALLRLAEDSFGVRDASRVVFVQDRGTMDDLLRCTDGYNLGTGCMSRKLIGPEIRAVPLNVPWQIHIGYIRKSGQVMSEEALTFIEYLTEAVRAAMPAEKKDG